MSRTNNDFRALLLNPSANTTATTTTSQTTTASSSSTSNAERAQAKEARRQHYASKHRKQQQQQQQQRGGDNDTEQNDVAMATQYRDRAAERRQGKVIDGVDDAARVDASKFTEDESKHLGGDVEHTHLVKGLDFTLLARVRAQQQQEHQQVDVPMVTDDGDVASVPATSARRKKKLVAVSDDTVASRTALGKSVLKALFGEPPTQNPRMFPGHMYYSFDLAPSVPPLPKSVVRAMADVPTLAYEMSSVEKLVLARVSRTVAESRDPSIRARKAAAVAARVAADAAAEAAALAAARRAEQEADEDIFADAGTYVAAIVPEEVSVPQQHEQRPIGAALFEAELRDAQLADEQRAADAAALYEEMEGGDAYPNTDDAYPNTDDAYPNTDDAYPNTDDAYPNTDDAYPNTDDAYPNKEDDSSASSDDIELDEDADERARKLLIARGLAVAEDEYGIIGMSTSTLPSVFGGDDDDDGDNPDVGGKKKREMSGDAKAKQDERQRASKFDRDLKTVAKMVDKKATDRGAKRLIGEHTGANEKKRNRK
jgi:hypothetical protein